MRFWITKNSQVAVREQLVRQVVLGILSEDLPAGHKLPSVRALARRHGIHSNTVSAAYHDLMAQGWLELRKGSGLYVRPLQPANGGEGGLDRLLTGVLQAARAHGYEPEAVLARLENLVRPRAYGRILIAEPEKAMREILLAEIAPQAIVPVDAAPSTESFDAVSLSRCLVVALPTRAIQIRRNLPPGVLCISLKLRSVERSLAGESRPAPDSLIAIVSRSVEIRKWAQAVLIAVGLDPQSLLEIDSAEADWRERLSLAALIVADVVTASELPPNRVVKVFRVVADSSIAEIAQICAR